MMTKFQRAIYTVPFLGAGIIALIVAIWLVGVAAAVGWALRLLEIQSVYDRLLPDWTAMSFFIASVAAIVSAKMLANLLMGKGG